MNVVVPAVRSTESAISLASLIETRARADKVPWLAASVIEGPLVLLGSSQRAGRVLNLDACVRSSTSIYRRATSGTAAFVREHGLMWTLALPHVASLVSDATRATLLNRNVRALLRAFTKAVGLSHYFGREWISTQHRPSALLGYDIAPDGVAVIDVIAGFEHSIELPREIATELENTTDRWRGKSPIALREAMQSATTPLALLQRITDLSVASWNTSPDRVEIDSIADAIHRVIESTDPLDASARIGEPVPCAIGFVEAAQRSDGTLWLGGDALVSRSELDHFAREFTLNRGSETFAAMTVEGAQFSDYQHAIAKLNEARDPY